MFSHDEALSKRYESNSYFFKFRANQSQPKNDDLKLDFHVSNIVDI